MEENKEKTKRDKFYDFVLKHRAKIAGAIGLISGCFLGWFYTRDVSIDYHSLGDAFKYAYKDKEDDSVIITDEYDIEYEGKKHKGFSIIDKDPIDS